MAYYQCEDCEKYDREDINRYGEGWCTHYCKYYPKSDKACTHFERRSDYQTSGCFLTTAMCNIYGFEDNCFALEEMRKFRDNYLVKDSKYYPLLAEYEVVGPIISDKLYNDPFKMEVTNYYFENYIYNILVNLTTYKDYEDATNKYVEMVNSMKKMYGINENITDCDVCHITNLINTNNYKTKKKVLK